MVSLVPRIRRTSQNAQCLFNLDSRTHAIAAYPILSPQGASVFLYGHENGVTVVWRGGQHLKRTVNSETKLTSKNDAVMILDSDSDGGATAASAPTSTSSAFVEKAIFVESAESLDGGFPDVVQTLDLAFGTAILNVAVLPLAPCAAKDAQPSLLQEQMVFAVTCATAQAYVVTLPLTPPSHESKERLQLQSSLLAGNAGHGAFGEVLISLGGQTVTSTDIALALATPKAASAVSASSLSTRVIVAASSREASGTLRLWDVTVGAKRASASSTSDRPLEPFQAEFLPRPVTGIAFNPAHPTQLLAISPQDAVRIYDYTIPSIPSDEAYEGPFPPQGSWLLSLYPPFARSMTTSAVRKPIVDAAWIAHGRAVLVLLADGQWGVWELDSTSSGKGNGVFAGRLPASGIRGAALTAFSISGQIEGTTPLRNPVASTRKAAEGEFVPMTPHTRRDALASAFSGKIEGLVALKGGVEVVQQPVVRSGAIGSESAVIWLGGADYIVAVIPDIARFCDTQARRASGGAGGNMFSGPRPARMTRLVDLNTSLMGERCCGVSAISRVVSPRPAANCEDDDDDDDDDGDGAVPSDNRQLPIEILLQGESRLVLVRENDDDSFSGDLRSRLFPATSRKRATGRATKSAIVVEPRARKIGAVAFNLNVNKPASTRGHMASANAKAGTAARSQSQAKSLFGPLAGVEAKTAAAEAAVINDDRNELSFTQSMMVPQGSAVATHKLAFAGNLDSAANASDDEEAANDRNVEEEMLNIMEIDQVLEAMEVQRGTDTQNVFFEGE